MQGGQQRKKQTFIQTLPGTPHCESVCTADISSAFCEYTRDFQGYTLPVTLQLSCLINNGNLQTSDLDLPKEIITPGTKVFLCVRSAVEP